MSIENLGSKSAWPASRVREFLETYHAPLRLGVLDASGFPLICSLWFRYVDGRILCATKRKAKVVDCIRANPKCGFELGPNEPPYLGVRGRGIATVAEEGAVELLGSLVDRYVGSRDTQFSQWLLKGGEDEIVLEIEVQWMTSWDYSRRMSE
jgi:hypothetical protein